MKRKFGISRSIGEWIALELYQKILEAVFQDREIDGREEEKLSEIRSYLDIGVDPKKLNRLESQQVQKLYYHFLDFFFADDLVEKHEMNQLQLIQEKLQQVFPGVNMEWKRDHQMKILNSTLKKVKEDGIVTADEALEVDKLMALLEIPQEVRDWIRRDLATYPKEKQG